MLKTLRNPFISLAKLRHTEEKIKKKFVSVDYLPAFRLKK